MFVENFPEVYIKDLTNRPKLKHPIKAVVACGNGTAGAFAPKILEALGVEVVPLDTELDHTFPKYNPNPEDMEMLHAMRDAVLEHKADVALGFDGDGDRCGVVDNTGEEIFADKVGVLLARDLAKLYPNSTFVVDVKSTGLFATDPELIKLGVKADYWKTGHSYMKRRVNETGALVGFEKSGHYFFNKPVGRGYDDGLVSAIAVLDMLDRNPGKKLSELREALPKTWSSPTMSPHCADEAKYGVVAKVVEHYEKLAAEGATRHRPEDPRPRDGERRARHLRGRLLGPACAPPPTSPSWWWWWKARSPKPACARCSRRSTACCVSTPASANTTRRSEAVSRAVDQAAGANGFARSIRARSSGEFSVCQRSVRRWTFSQKSGLLPKTRARMSAVAAVTVRRSLHNSFTCFRETPMASASAAWVRPSGTMNSSTRISPTPAGLRLVIFRMCPLSAPSRPPARRGG